MPTFDEYLSMLQPNPEQARKQAMWQALAGLGAGLLGGRNWQQGLSRGGLLAYDAMQGSQDRAAQDAMVALKQRMAAQEMADKDLAREKQTKLDAAAANSFIPGSPGSPEMGPPTAQGMMQPAVPPTAPTFDFNKYITQVAPIDPMRAIQVQQSMAKDSPLDKPKPENYTAASLALFAQTLNFGDLVPIAKPDASPMGKVNPADFTPASVAKFFQTNDFRDLVPIDKRAVTNVSVKNVTGDAEGKVIGEWRGQTYADIQKAGANSYGKLNKLNAIERTLAGIDTNKLTPVGMAVAGPLRAAGIDIDPNLGPKEAADSVVKQMALEMRNPSGGAGMPGAMSDADREFLLNTVPNLSQTPGGRNLIIEVQRRLARRDQEIAKLAREFRNKNNGFDERFYDELAQKFGNTDLFGDLMKTFKGNGLPPGVTVQRER